MVSTWLNSLDGSTPQFGAYWVGGSPSGKAIVKTVFGSDATSTLAATLGTSSYGFAGFGNGIVAGYTCGNDIGSGAFGSNVISKQTFADESNVEIAATLSGLMWGQAGAANSGTAGYSAGGQERNGSSAVIDIIDKLVFSDESCAAISPVLSADTFAACGAANSGTAAYWFGGYTTSASNKIDKTDFSDDSTAAITPTLTANSQYSSGMANSGTAAYAVMGYTGSTRTRNINKTVFSDDGTTNLGDLLASPARYATAAAAQKGTHGYVAGGHAAGSGNQDVIEKLLFSDDSMSSLGTGLPIAKNSMASFASDGSL
jgi:hypothetical protein